MQILVRVVSPPAVAEFVPGQPGPGHRFVFSENIELVRYDGVAQNNQLAGSYSGLMTILRIAEAGDIYPQGSYLFQYEGIYRFNTVPNTPLMRGQVTARGMLHGNLDNQGNFTPLDGPMKVAITGGTEAYATARGEITERDPAFENKRLDIQV